MRWTTGQPFRVRAANHRFATGRLSKAGGLASAQKLRSPIRLIQTPETGFSGEIFFPGFIFGLAQFASQGFPPRRGVL